MLAAQQRERRPEPLGGRERAVELAAEDLRLELEEIEPCLDQRQRVRRQRPLERALVEAGPAQRRRPLAQPLQRPHELPREHQSVGEGCETRALDELERLPDLALHIGDRVAGGEADHYDLHPAQRREEHVPVLDARADAFAGEVDPGAKIARPRRQRGAEEVADLRAVGDEAAYLHVSQSVVEAPPTGNQHQ